MNRSDKAVRLEVSPDFAKAIRIGAAAEGMSIIEFSKTVADKLNESVFSRKEPVQEVKRRENALRF
jgi:hypothetical protein